MSKFLFGALAGLVAGILIAPDKGSNTREQIADTAEKWKHKLDRMLGRTDAELDDLRAALSHEIRGLSDDVRNRILTILDEAEEMAYSSRQMGNGVV